MSWKEKWEFHAAKERDRYMQTPVPELLEQVKNGIHGLYYTIWYVIAERATLEEATSPLFQVISGKGDYLFRYHAAAALLKLSGIDDFKPVDLSGTHLEVSGNILEMERLLRQKGFLSN